ncbi:MAG: TonB-dependent receptor [Myxococcales bacterium]|nr:TonB-dependent receptor [Myxococcales bacterium]MCB9629948.1 TonB-dependent receptor [Sandaracinaceae bacterium]
MLTLRPLPLATLALSLTCCAAVALAAPAPARADLPPPVQPVITPPRVLRTAQAELPAELIAELAADAVVLLELIVGVDGAVTEAHVLEGLSPELDAAALAAIQRFVFDPARRDLEPMAARIRYAFSFALPQVDAGPQLPPLGTITGVIRSHEDAPVASAQVLIVSRDEAVVRRVTTAADGRFEFEMLPPGTYDVRVTIPDADPLVYEEEVLANEATDLVYRLPAPPPPEEEEEEIVFGAEAVVDPPPREITRRSIRGEQLRTIPGTAGDALRAVEILPGVARPPFGAGALIVRGSAPGDSEVFFEGVSVPLLYHFGGLKSVINSRLLEGIDFYPGNFSSRYGRRTGGILEVSLRDPATDRFHGLIEASAIDLSFIAEGPITENFSIAVAARRSLIDLVFDAVVPEDIGVVAAPVYYDYQLFTSWRPNPRDRLRLLFYGSSDRFALNIEDSFGDDPAARGTASLTSRFFNQQLIWDRQVDSRTEQELAVTFGPIQARFSLGQLGFRGTFRQIYSRYERRMQINEHVRVLVGSDVFITPVKLTYNGPQLGQSEGGGSDSAPLAGRETVNVALDTVVVRPGFYLETNIDADPMRFVLGTRVDYFGEINQWVFNPRLSVMASATDTLRFKAAAGMYSQPPEFNESNSSIGNNNLEPIHSAHFGAGVDWDFHPGMTVGLEGFYKPLWNRVVAIEGGVEPYFENGGRGRIYGMELSARINPDDGAYVGYLSYTLSRSERLDHPNDPDAQWRLFDFDQTHILTLSFTYNLPRNWSLGGTVRIVSGNPSTPIIGSVYDALNDVYIPIDGRTNSQRNPLFHRLDVRVEKKWIWDSFQLAFFLDIQNAYNQANQEGLIYNFNYRQSTQINGLPIIPAIGIRGEL